MTRGGILSGTLFVSLLLGGGVAGIAASTSAQAQYVACPPGYYFYQGYGCVPPGYFYGPPYYPYPDLGFEFFYGPGWGGRWGGGRGGGGHPGGGGVHGGGGGGFHGGGGGGGFHGGGGGGGHGGGGHGH